jgi:hypothetical protein
MRKAEATPRALEVSLMSRPFPKRARANPSENGLAGVRRAVSPDSPATSALPDGADAIRVDFDDDEPAAVVFNDQAQPGALVSWAWCQLTALDGLLRALVARQSPHDCSAGEVEAVRNVLVPVINALALSERRAHALRREREASTRRSGDRKGNARKDKRARK